MAPPMRTHQTRRRSTETTVSGPYMTFSMSVMLAYHHATLTPAQAPSHSRSHSRRKRPRAASPSSAPSAPPAETATTPLATTVAPSLQEPLPGASARDDSTLERLSTEAQTIQDLARTSYNTRKSNLSDRESLRCLQSFPLHIHTHTHRSTERPTRRPEYQPQLLPKYFPSPSSSSRRRFPGGTFDSDAALTTPTSSDRPPGSPQELRASFSDDSEIFEDDEYFLQEDGERSIGDRLPKGGISLYARLAELRTREAREGSSASSQSTSLPRVPSSGTTESAAGNIDDAEEEEEEEEDWTHVQNFDALKREIEQVYNRLPEPDRSEIVDPEAMSQESIEGLRIFDNDNYPQNQWMHREDEEEVNDSHLITNAIHNPALTHPITSKALLGQTFEAVLDDAMQNPTIRWKPTYIRETGGYRGLSPRGQRDDDEEE